MSKQIRLTYTKKKDEKKNNKMAEATINQI